MTKTSNSKRDQAFVQQYKSRALEMKKAADKERLDAYLDGRKRKIEGRAVAELERFGEELR